jgi:glycosyltransferase involved in cell wall biosynthesis
VYSAQNIHKRYPLPFRLAERHVLHRAAAAYPCSTEAGEVLRRKGFRGRLDVLPLGVSPVDADRPAPNGRPRVGFVGRLVSEKGGDVALEAFAAAGVDARLEIVGSGPEEDRLRALAARLGLGDRVVFAGPLDQENALERIRTFDLLLVPSLTTPRWKEQFGRVAVQALAAGTPVVASSSGSLPEVLDGCGELVPEGDSTALAGALRMLLHDDRRRADLARRGLVRAEQLSWERVAGGFDRMYREVLGRA